MTATRARIARAPRTARARRGARSTARARRGKRRAPTPEDIARFAFVGSPQVSPDGRRIVFVRKRVGDKNDYATSLWMVGCDEQGPPVAFTSGGKDGSPLWSPDGSRIAFTRKGEKNGTQIYLIGAAGGEATQLTHFPEGSIGGFRWSPDGRALAVRFREEDPEWSREAKKRREEKGLADPPRVLDDWWYRLDGDGYFGAQRHRLYIVDVASGDHRLVYRDDTLGFFSFDFSPDGKRLVIATNRDRKALIRPWLDEILILNVSTGKTTPVPRLPRGPKDSVVWSPDGKRLAYVSRIGEDSTYSVENLELYVCDPDRGQARSLTGREDYCLLAAPITDMGEIDFSSQPRWSPDSRRIYFKLGWHGESHVASVAAKGGRIRFHTRGAFDYDFGNCSRDEKRFALIRSSVVHPAEVFVGEKRGETIRPRGLTDLNRPLRKELKLSRIASHWLTTPEGTKVQVWVMLPPDHRPGGRSKYPAVLEIHGGPHAQYGVGFFNEFQILASQGYAVFFSNPRGSKGYGRDHCAAIRGHWGNSDWVDIQTVTRFMQGHPNVNAKRMGIMGGSYGGYMTNWAIGHTDAFAGAITDRSVSNILSMGGTSDFPDEPDRYFPGNFWDRTEARWEQSPIKYIGAAKTPTLIIHSEGDLRCNIEQAEQLFTALKLLDVPTRFVRYPRSSSHGMSRGGPPDLRIHRLHQILEWWKKYLKKK